MARIVTGIKPTGTPHLGNYLGMVEPALRLATEHDAHYFIADYHALNTAPAPDSLRGRTHEIAATFLALGLDPERSTLYRQSAVPGVFELAQILAGVTPKGLMNRAHAYKAAVAGNRQRGQEDDVDVNMGLYSYPLLMAADILGPAGDRVPVGSDQKQHLEITRHVADAFNARYGPVLRPPAPVIDERVMTVPGTDGRKMSKSHANTIPILAEPDSVRAAVRRIVTDSRSVGEPKEPAGDITFRLYALVAAPEAVNDLRHRYLAGGLRYVDAKRQLADLLVQRFADARDRYVALLADPDRIEAALDDGAARARRRTEETLVEVRAAVGVGPCGPVAAGFR